ncbi:MAG: hypothetical protein ACXV3A_08540 [Kineosporiaceae bacterium]
MLAKALGRVPIAGATAEVGGLILTADSFEGRRNQLATVLVRRAEGADGGRPLQRADQQQPTRIAAS